MIWNNPEAFLLCIPLFYVYIYFSFFAKNKKEALFYSGLNPLLRKSVTLRTSFIFLPKLLKVSALVFVIVALARPQTTEDKTHETQKGVDIMIVMDISLSMLVEDMGRGITRLDSAKKVVKDFIDGRPRDRMGLITFSGESFTRVPLTFDHKLLKSSLSQVTPLPSLKGGTAIGVALANATLRFMHSPKDSRIIIFLTDGVNNTGFIEPETALEVVRKNHIKVYTIGIGSREGTFPIKYEVSNARGQKFYRRIPIYSEINTDLMKKISYTTNGAFFMAKDLMSLKRIFNRIDLLETYDIQVDKWTRYEEHFKFFLIIGITLYFLSTLLSLIVFFKGI